MSARWGRRPVAAGPLNCPMSWAPVPVVQADTRPVGRGSSRGWVAAGVVTVALAVVAASVTTIVLAGQVCA